VADTSGPKIIAFCAQRCGPCKVLGPQLDLVSVTERGRLRVLKMDTEESAANAALATRFLIRALPTILWVSSEGDVVQRAEGETGLLVCARAAAFALRQSCHQQSRSQVSAAGERMALAADSFSPGTWEGWWAPGACVGTCSLCASARGPPRVL